MWHGLQVTPNGKLTTLFNFCSQGGNNCTDGVTPWPGLIEAGRTPGSARGGGAKADGTVFRIAPKANWTQCTASRAPSGATPCGRLLPSQQRHFFWDHDLWRGKQ